MAKPGFDVGDDGLIHLWPVIAFTTGVMGEMAVALRLDFVRSETDLADGRALVGQFILTPAQAVEIAEALRSKAEIALGLPSPGAPRN